MVRQEKIYSLQALRFVAALMVIHLHAVEVAVMSSGHTGYLGSGIGILGRAGVDIFFVISGVIIARTAPGLTASAFMRKRLIRVVPLYLVWCTPKLLIAGVHHALSWRVLLATALWPATDRMTASVLGVAWTLSFEMLFYAAAALVLLGGRTLWGLLLLYALAFLMRAHGPVFQFLGNPIIIEFLAGVAIAYLPGTSRWLGLSLIAIGATSLIAGAWLLLPPIGDTIDFLLGAEAIPRLAVLGIPATLIVYGTMQMPLQRGAMTYLGDASYSLYLTHPLIMTIIVSAMQLTAIKAAPDLIIVASIGLSLLFGWRTYELIERPLLDFLRRRKALVPATSGSAAAP